MDAIAGIHEANRNLPSELIVIPIGLAEQDGPKNLHVTLNPGGTSVLELGPAWSNRYKHSFGTDFDFPESTEVIEDRPIEARSLDSLLTSMKDDLPPPDFLSLDTQGSEYEILLGAREAIVRQTCGLIVEVEFVELYQGQKRYQEICDILYGLGFAFVRFVSIGEQSGYRGPLGFRAAGYQTFAEALFLRRPECIDPAADTALRVYKNLCFVAIVFDLTELAVECFERLKKIKSPDAIFEAPRYEYEKFLAELFDVYQRSNRILPPAFSQVLPRARLKQLSVYAPYQWPRILSGLCNIDDSYLSQVGTIQLAHETEFEAVLKRYDFVKLAEFVGSERRDQAHKIRAAIELARMARGS